MVINNTYRGISTEYAGLLNAPGVQQARQSIVHIMDTNRDFVVVYNYTDVPANLKRAWSMRLAVTPVINLNSFWIPEMNTTIVAPMDHTITWVGGLNDEFKSPPPELQWYGNNRSGNTPGFSANPDKAKANGIGNLYVQPQNPPEQLEFLVVIEISDLTPVAVSRVSDNEVIFGRWQVSFNPDGNFIVTDTSLPDLIFINSFE